MSYTKFECPPVAKANLANPAKDARDLPLAALAEIAISRGRERSETDRPSTVSTRRWQQVLADAAYVGREWADRAATLGWSDLDLFGADRRVPDRRYDRMGLCWSLRGRGVVALTAETATIATPTGGHLTYRCRRLEFGESTIPAELATAVSRSNGTSPTKSGRRYVG